MMVFENHAPLTRYDFQPILIDDLTDDNPVLLKLYS